MTQLETIAVVGCGLIGESWSALFTAYGHDVVAWDPSPRALDGFAARVERASAHVRKLRSDEPVRQGTLTIAPELEEAVVSARWIQENAPESVPLKHDLYARIESATSPQTIMASSTSSLTWSELSAGMLHKGRLITAHPFNPPHLMPLVEIYAPDAVVRQQAYDFYRQCDRKPVMLARDAVGHIANRLSSALWREAVNIVAEGIAGVSEVDAALVHGPGLRWSVVGAHMAYHLGGGPGGIEHYLSHLGPSQVRRWSTLGTPSLTPEVCQQLIDGIKVEAAGRSQEMLEQQRDRALIGAIAARRDTPCVE